MTRWFTSDHHFWHRNILEYEPARQKFGDIEGMNEELIYRHNSLVAPKDEVYFLGDICFAKDDVATNIISRMNGSKVLIMGNHDRKSPSRYRSYGFRGAHRHGFLLTIMGKNVRLQHFPQVPEEDMVPQGSTEFLLHGHTHQKTKRAGRKIHVGVDAWDFYPVHELCIWDLMKDWKVEREVKKL